jgi:hypothetical protein
MRLTPQREMAAGYLSGLGTAGVGRGTGRLLSFTFVLVGREFVFLWFTLDRGAEFVLSTVVFAFGRFTFAGRFAFVDRLAFVFVFALPFRLSFAFLGFGFLGLFSFALAEAFVFRFSFGSSAGVTVSGDSPALAVRLMSIATV